MAQIIPIVSEALQSTIRRLLPSQSGFGEDLQAQNVIVPIIDLTPTAEGSVLPYELQTAAAFVNNTGFSVQGTSTTLISNTGFWRILGTATFQSTTSPRSTKFAINDGLGDKNVYEQTVVGAGTSNEGSVGFDFVVFLRPGDTFKCTASAGMYAAGSYRQIASITGELINPTGFSF